MSQTTPPTVDAPPPAPSIASPSTFDALADAFIAWFATFVTQVTALASNMYGNAVDAYNNAVAADASADAAEASSVSAIAAANVTKWVSGTTYSEGQGAWSPLNYQSYRRKIAGAGTTDPSLDSTNWALLGPRKSPGATILDFNSFGGL